MHRSTRDHLEQLLKADGSATAAQTHAQHCAECVSELAKMRQQSTLIRSLRSDEDYEPAPGFYARVLQCIEERARYSVWYGLAYSRFGQRIAYASLSLALVLGIYVAVEEHSEQQNSTLRAVVAPQLRPEVSAEPTAADQRDAVLVNFASYTTSDDPLQ